MFFSVIIPVFNRPREVDELLASLEKQTYKDFEVLVIDDGSSITCEEVVEQYSNKLKIRYFHKENSGQGFTRNFGYDRARGDYFVVFDSDCILPSRYFDTVVKNLNSEKLDAWGGPDKAHEDFSPVQKAINYSMTSIITTGGIRGSKKPMGPYHPRSFNMGISREVFNKTRGYILPKMGEDIEFSIRIIRSGFKVGYIEEAYVYHKRRTNLVDFFRQLFFFGRARINVGRYFPDQVKLVHYLPFFFLLGLLIWITSPLYLMDLFIIGALALILTTLFIFIDSLFKHRSLKVAFLCICTSFIQLIAYGTGFIKEMLAKWIGGEPEFKPSYPRR